MARFDGADSATEELIHIKQQVTRAITTNDVRLRMGLLEESSKVLAHCAMAVSRLSKRGQKETGGTNPPVSATQLQITVH
jgi:hypothetical protein